MKWLHMIQIIFVLVSPLVLCEPAHAETAKVNLLAHTGEQCQKTYQSSKKIHPSQRIFYETINGKKCYHVHVVARSQTEKDVSYSAGQMDATFHMKNSGMCLAFNNFNKVWCPIYNVDRAQDEWDYEHNRNKPR